MLQPKPHLVVFALPECWQDSLQRRAWRQLHLTFPSTVESAPKQVRRARLTAVQGKVLDLENKHSTGWDRIPPLPQPPTLPPQASAQGPQAPGQKGKRWGKLHSLGEGPSMSLNLTSPGSSW